MKYLDEKVNQIIEELAKQQMKSVIISTQPKWCKQILNGKKTIEVRKSRPKIETPFKCYIYCTNDRKIVLDSDNYYNFFLDKNHGGAHYFNGKVIGEFVCDKIYDISAYNEFYGTHYGWNFDFSLSDTCLTESEFEKYFSQNINGYIKPLNGYGWHISDLKIYGLPKELGEFYKPCNHANDCCTCKWALYRYRQPRYKPVKGQRIYYDEEFAGCGNKITRPPQSWCYVEGI
ncbi:MAG: ASCH domain-containing protein [Candidatus Coproplasma sp.]